MELKDILLQHNIEYQDKQEYNTTCPKCSDERNKSDQRCLRVSFGDKNVRWRCFHGDCEWAGEKGAQTFMLNKPKNTTKASEIKEGFQVWSTDGKWEPDIKELFDKAIKYPYYNRDEQLIFYILRVGDGDKKYIRPISLNSEGKYVLARPNAELPFRAEFFDPAKPTIVVEGEKAAEAAAKLAKKSNVLSWAGGAQSVTSTDWSILKGADVTLWPDNDKPGIKAMDELSNLLVTKFPPARLFIIDPKELPEHYDAADIADASVIKKLFDNKTEVQIDTPLDGELNPLDLTALHSKEYKYYKTGFPTVDKYVQFPNSGLVVISGRTGHGKTNMMINMALNLAKDTDLTVLYLSYEFPLTELNMRMVKALDGRRHKETGWEEDIFIDKAIREQSLPAVKEYAELLKARKIRVVDSNTSIDQVLAAMNRLAVLGKPVAVFIDYLQVIPIQDSGKNRYLQLKEMVEKIRLVANKNSQLLIGGSQLTAGELGYADSVRESKDIEFTATLHLKVWNKLKVMEKPKGFKQDGTPIYDKSYANVEGDIVMIVEKARQYNANGKAFGFTSENGCDLKPVIINNKDMEY